MVRKALPCAKILILGYTPKECLKSAIAHNIEMCVYHEKIAALISREATKQGKIARLHIKIDTGMGRIGYCVESRDCDSADFADGGNSSNSAKSRESGGFEGALSAVESIAKLPNISIAGVFTHFSSADSTNREDLAYTQRQFEIYSDFVKALESRGIRGFLRHCSNSAGIFSFKQGVLDMVRVGIVSYGISVFADTSGLLKPVMSFKTRIIHIKTLPPNHAVSYGRTFVTHKPMRIATLSVGYADGYSRLLSNKAEVLIHGRRAKIVGNICMDQCMADISGIDGVEIGDEAVLFGCDDLGNAISADEIAQKMGTISYEVLCGISGRVPRVDKR